VAIAVTAAPYRSSACASGSSGGAPAALTDVMLRTTLEATQKVRKQVATRRTATGKT